jgi:hypothetical protein
VSTAVLVGGAAAAAVTLPSPAKQETVRIRFRTVVKGIRCDLVDDLEDERWGFDDVPGATVLVRDRDGKLLGATEVERRGDQVGGDCMYQATDDIVVPERRVYEVGNSQRGTVIARLADVDELGVVHAEKVLS